MNIEHMEQWADVLESGDYSQARKVLRQLTGNAGYCCLGVAADISGVGTWDTKNRTRHATYVCEFREGGVKNYTNPTNDNGKLSLDGNIVGSAVEDWLGMKEGNAYNFAGNRIRNRDNAWASILVGMNDSGKNFKAIAKVIRTAVKAEKQKRLDKALVTA